MNWPLILLWAAVGLFLLVAFGVDAKRINLTALGLACFAASFLPF